MKQQFELRLPGESFTVRQLRAAVALLADPGVAGLLEFGGSVLRLCARQRAPGYDNACTLATRILRKHSVEN